MAVCRVIFLAVIFMVLYGFQMSTAQNVSNLVVYVQGIQSGDYWAVEDDDGTILDEVKWPGDAGLVRQYVLNPGAYEIFLPGPVKSLTLNAAPGSSTFLEIAPYHPEDGQSGVQITSWSGRPTKQIDEAFSALKAGGLEGFLKPVNLSPAENVLYFTFRMPPGVKPPPNE